MADLYNLDIHDISEDIHKREANSPEINIKTHYEKLDIAQTKKVFYLCFTLPEEQIPVPDMKLKELLKEIENAESL